MIRYYKLFDLLNRRGMKKSDLREILSPKTVAKLSKGEFVSGEVIDKICRFLHCQPGDIMEVIEDEILFENGTLLYETTHIVDTMWDDEKGEDVTESVMNLRDSNEDKF